MLIHELGKKERMLVVEEASIRSRYLWPEGAEASLAHGVWSQLLKDLATLKLHYYAVEDWEGSDDHWFASGFGVAQGYLDDLLRSWAFLGEGRDLEVAEVEEYESEAEGCKACTLCKEEKKMTEFYRTSNTKSGRQAQCAECRRGIARGIFDR